MIQIPPPAKPSSASPRLIIGSRGSALARTQARWVEATLRRSIPGLLPEIHIIKTEGDRSQTTLLTAATTVGIFVREIEEELLAKRIDLAVHSLKDLPTAQPHGLMVVAIPVREDPHDVLVVREGSGLKELPRGATVGTGSPRRIGQIRALRPDLTFNAIRGNVDTRIRKLHEGQVDALVLAAAGLKRLAIKDGVFHPFPLEQMLPAPGQGALAVEIRSSDHDLATLISRHLHHSETAAAVRAERAFLLALGGGCQMPVGALGSVEGERLKLSGVVAAPDGSRLLRRSLMGSPTQPEEVGQRLGEILMQQGAGELLENSSREGPGP